MPSEPGQTKIEELLKSYAKKRAEDAGSMAELHPATRRLLQGEVAKLRREVEASAGRSWIQSLIVLWPRLAAVSAILVMLVTGVWLLLPESQPSATMLARNDGPFQSKAVREEKSGRDFDGDAPVTAPRPDALASASPSSPAPLKREISDKTSVKLQDEKLLAEVRSRLKQDVPTPGPVPASGEGLRLAAAETSMGQNTARPMPVGGSLPPRLTMDAGIDAGAPASRFDLASSKSGEALGTRAVPLTSPTPAPVPQPVLAPTAPTVSASRSRVVVTQPAVRAPEPADHLAFSKDAAVVSVPAPTVPALAAGITTATSGELTTFRRMENQTSGSAEEQAQELKLRFVQPDKQQKVTALKAAPTAGALLGNFQLERHGAVVRVIDGDGSIYTGQVLDTGATDAADRAKVGTPAAPGSGTASRDTPFRVTGIHRTTRQAVMFEGTLLTDLSLEGGAAATLAKSLAQAPARPGVGGRSFFATAPSANTNAFSTRRVVGTVRVNGTNAFAVQAISVMR